MKKLVKSRKMENTEAGNIIFKGDGLMEKTLVASEMVKDGLSMDIFLNNDNEYILEMRTGKEVFTVAKDTNIDTIKDIMKEVISIELAHDTKENKYETKNDLKSMLELDMERREVVNDNFNKKKNSEEKRSKRINKTIQGSRFRSIVSQMSPELLDKMNNVGLSLNDVSNLYNKAINDKLDFDKYLDYTISHRKSIMSNDIKTAKLSDMIPHPSSNMIEQSTFEDIKQNAIEEHEVVTIMETDSKELSYMITLYNEKVFVIKSSNDSLVVLYSEDARDYDEDSLQEQIVELVKLAQNDYNKNRANSISVDNNEIDKINGIMNSMFGDDKENEVEKGNSILDKFRKGWKESSSDKENKVMENNDNDPYDNFADSYEEDYDDYTDLELPEDLINKVTIKDGSKNIELEFIGGEVDEDKIDDAERSVIETIEIKLSEDVVKVDAIRYTKDNEDYFVVKLRSKDVNENICGTYHMDGALSVLDDISKYISDMINK